jgi:iron(III) transport system permease protein
MPHLAVALLAVGDGWYGTVLPVAWTADHLRGALAHPLVVPAITNSLRYAAGATALALVLGGFVAWVAVRARPWGWRALDLAATLPLAIPGVILAFGYLALTARTPGLHWLDPRLGAAGILVIAYAVRRLPYAARAIAAGLGQVPPAAEEAAATLGAGPGTRLYRIVAPLCAASIAAAALLAFSLSMLEVGDSLILAQQRADYPITKVIYELVSLLGAGPAIACAFGLWAMTFLALALAGTALLLGRRLGGNLTGRPTGA